MYLFVSPIFIFYTATCPQALKKLIIEHSISPVMKGFERVISASQPGLLSSELDIRLFQPHIVLST